SDAEVAAQIRTFLSDYDAHHAEIERMVNEAGFSPDVRDRILDSLVTRATWLREVGLPQLEARSPDARVSETSDAARVGIIPRRDPSSGPGIDSISPEVRAKAAETYHDVITRLESGEDILMPRGTASVEMMRGITLATGREVTLARNSRG